MLDKEWPGKLHTDERNTAAPCPVEERILMADLGVTTDTKLVNLASLYMRWSLC